MPKKIKLDLQDLKVQSFTTTENLKKIAGLAPPPSMKQWCESLYQGQCMTDVLCTSWSGCF